MLPLICGFFTFTAPLTWNLSLLNSPENDASSWPRTTTTLTYLVKLADPSRGPIKKYDVFVVYYGQREPDDNSSPRSIAAGDGMNQGDWHQATLDGQTLPFAYKDKTLTTGLNKSVLTIKIGENDHPLRPGSYYKIFLRAYTTVR